MTDKGVASTGIVHSAHNEQLEAPIKLPFEAPTATPPEDLIKTIAETLSIKPTNTYNDLLHTTSAEPFHMNYNICLS
jgi:hypothetical protein